MASFPFPFLLSRARVRALSRSLSLALSLSPAPRPPQTWRLEHIRRCAFQLTAKRSSLRFSVPALTCFGAPFISLPNKEVSVAAPTEGERLYVYLRNGWVAQYAVRYA